MPRTEDWLLEQGEGEIYVISSWVTNQGALRLKTAANLVGPEEAKKIARKEGCYELSDTLVRELKLEGIEIQGEFQALSPSRWLRSSALEPRRMAFWKEYFAGQNKELVGISVSAGERRALLAFLKGRPAPPKDPWDLVEIADHFFQQDSLRLVWR